MEAHFQRGVIRVGKIRCLKTESHFGSLNAKALFTPEKYYPH